MQSFEFFNFKPHLFQLFSLSEYFQELLSEAGLFIFIFVLMIVIIVCYAVFPQLRNVT
jgi:uncharacterized protein involved in exopolysaccharide biosynthesis